MRTRIALAVLLAATASIVEAQTGNVARLLTELEDQWGAAMVRADVAALDRIIAPDWTLIDPSGEVVSRSQAIADLKSGADKVESFANADVKVRVFGDVAVVTGRATSKEQYKGKDVGGDFRYTDVFVKRNGRWQAVATQVTRITPP